MARAVGAPFTHDGRRYVARLISGDIALQVQGQWLANATAFPLQQRADWSASDEAEEWHALGLWESTQDASAAPAALVGLRSYKSRAMPGFFVVRALKLGPGIPEALRLPVLRAIREAASVWPRLLRLHVELFEPDDARRTSAIATARQLGFRLETSPREYRHTLILPLDGGADAYRRNFHRMLFKNARKVERAGLCVRSFDDEALAPRLDALTDETMRRTGANAMRVNWIQRIRATAAHPNVYRLTGLFESTAPDARLLAFRWNGVAGNYADDLAAASTRAVDPTHGNIPMMPAILLDALEWARASGAQWFDFGGIVLPDSPSYEQQHSITEFKLLFGGTIAEVGADLTFEPRPWLSSLAHRVSRLSRGRK